MTHPIVEQARTQTGVKYRHQGRTWGQLLDCAGLVVLAARRSGFVMSDASHYTATPYSGRLEMEMDNQPELARVFDQPRPGDIALISWNGSDCQHLGIITDHPDGLGIIHTYSKAGKVTETRFGGYLRSVTKRFYRW